MEAVPHAESFGAVAYALVEQCVVNARNIVVGVEIHVIAPHPDASVDFGGIAARKREHERCEFRADFNVGRLELVGALQQFKRCVRFAESLAAQGLEIEVVGLALVGSLRRLTVTRAACKCGKHENCREYVE